MKQEDIDNLKVGDFIGWVSEYPIAEFKHGLMKISKETKTRFVFDDNSYQLKKDLIRSIYKTEENYHTLTKIPILSIKIKNKINRFDTSLEKLEQITEILRLSK